MAPVTLFDASLLDLESREKSRLLFFESPHRLGAQLAAHISAEKACSILTGGKGRTMILAQGLRDGALCKSQGRSK